MDSVFKSKSDESKFDLAKKHGKMKQLKQCVQINKVSSFIDLFKHMTEPEHFNRMKPDKAYHKYLELDTLYLSKSKTTSHDKHDDEII